MKVREQKIFKKKFTKSFIIKKEEETIQYTLVSFVDMWRTTGMKKKRYDKNASSFGYNQIRGYLIYILLMQLILLFFFLKRTKRL
jgi:hypothetical protein